MAFSRKGTMNAYRKQMSEISGDVFQTFLEREFRNGSAGLGIAHVEPAAADGDEAVILNILLGD